jgi:hypothetical protein
MTPMRVSARGPGSTPSSSSRGPAPIEFWVWSVESTLRPVSAARIASRAVSWSRISPIIDDVGVVAEERARHRPEGRPHRLVDRHLLHACERHLDGILDRDDLEVLAVERVMIA